MFAATTNANSQTFMQHLKEKKDGQGSVTVTQSKAIDELVNGKVSVAVKPQEQHVKDGANMKGHANANPKTEQPKGSTGNSEKHTGESEAETPTAETHKKVMRNSYKVNGYRVQVYAGGNSRADKLKAQQAGNSIKQAFPDQPIYVHFYSPRWICRMGNFRSFEEANNILREVKKLGYKEACIVSGKIVVPY